MQAGAGLVLECCEEAFAVLCRRIIHKSLEPTLLFIKQSLLLARET